MGNYKKSTGLPPPAISCKDEVTYNKIQRHLTDINDTITEEDIRNIKIYSFVPINQAESIKKSKKNY